MQTVLVCSAAVTRLLHCFSADEWNGTPTRRLFFLHCLASIYKAQQPLNSFSSSQQIDWMARNTRLSILLTLSCGRVRTVVLMRNWTCISTQVTILDRTCMRIVVMSLNRSWMWTVVMTLNCIRMRTVVLITIDLYMYENRCNDNCRFVHVWQQL